MCMIILNLHMKYVIKSQLKACIVIKFLNGEKLGKLKISKFLKIKKRDEKLGRRIITVLIELKYIEHKNDHMDEQMPVYLYGSYEIKNKLVFQITYTEK